MQAQISMDFPISEILIRTKSPDFPIGNFDLAQATGFPNLEKPHCVDGDGPISNLRRGGGASPVISLNHRPPLHHQQIHEWIETQLRSKLDHFHQ